MNLQKETHACMDPQISCTHVQACRKKEINACIGLRISCTRAWACKNNKITYANTIMFTSSPMYVLISLIILAYATSMKKENL